MSRKRGRASSCVSHPFSWALTTDSDTTLYDWTESYLPKHYDFVYVADQVEPGKRTVYVSSKERPVLQAQGDYVVAVWERKGTVASSGELSRMGACSSLGQADTGGAALLAHLEIEGAGREAVVEERPVERTRVRPEAVGDERDTARSKVACQCRGEVAEACGLVRDLGGEDAVEARTG